MTLVSYHSSGGDREVHDRKTEWAENLPRFCPPPSSPVGVFVGTASTAMQIIQRDLLLLETNFKSDDTTLQKLTPVIVSKFHLNMSLGLGFLLLLGGSSCEHDQCLLACYLFSAVSFRHLHTR